MSAIFGEQLSFPQENGKEVELIVSGDEFYARHETLDGYTAVYDDPDVGKFCYAENISIAHDRNNTKESCIIKGTQPFLQIKGTQPFL